MNRVGQGAVAGAAPQPGGASRRRGQNRGIESEVWLKDLS
jgi:hypothetical protein